MKQRSRRALPVVLFAIFLDLVANGILVPVMPQLLADPDSPYYLLSSHIPLSYAYVLLGIIIAIFPLIQFFSTPILGEYSDYKGRRKVLTLALAGTAVSFALFALGIVFKSLTLIFASRIIGGIVGGNISVAQAAIADITPANKRAASFGLIGAAYGVGFIIGPVIGGVLSNSHLVSWFTAATPFWFATILSAINALLIWFMLAETRVPEEAVPITWNKAVSNVFRAYKMKSVRVIFAASFLFNAAISLFATFFTVFLIRRFDFDQTSVGYYIGYVGFWIVIAQAIVLPILSKRWDEFALLKVFLLAGGLAVFAYYIPDHLIGLLVVGALFALMNGVSMASLPSIISRRAPKNVQGEVLGINASVQALANVFPPILAGLLAAEITPAAPVYAAGGVLAAAWLVFMIGVKKEA